jgi:hypothetical protein
LIEKEIKITNKTIQLNMEHAISKSVRQCNKPPHQLQGEWDPVQGVRGLRSQQTTIDHEATKKATFDSWSTVV